MSLTEPQGRIVRIELVYKIHGKKRRARCSTRLNNVLLTTVNNVGSKTLFNPVFINIAST
jgi:hypothetical protein